MSCMMHACMTWKFWNDMLCSKMYDWSWFNACTIKPWRKMKERKPFLFSIQIFSIFFFESHYLDHSLFKQTFFVKKLFSFFSDHFQHGIFFSTTFIPDRNIFLFNIPKYIFSKKMNKTLTFNFFFNFLLQTKYRLIFLQRNKIENFSFLYFFFRNSIVQTSKNQFSWILNMSWNLLMQKNQRIF